MTAPTEALARALRKRYAWKQSIPELMMGLDDCLAALGYAVRPIEQAAEAADREAAGRNADEGDAPRYSARAKGGEG